MGIEIERKYLINRKEWLKVEKPQGIAFRQGYLVSDECRTVRIRTTDKKGFITIKGASSGYSRKEFEYEIPLADGNELMDNLAIYQLSKVRYCLNFLGNLWEVDEFNGANAGLITAEIEMPDENHAFEIPPYVGKEISGDSRYYNSSLASHPYQDWDL